MSSDCVLKSDCSNYLEQPIQPPMALLKCFLHYYKTTADKNYLNYHKMAIIMIQWRSQPSVHGGHCQ